MVAPRSAAPDCHVFRGACGRSVPPTLEKEWRSRPAEVRRVAEEHRLTMSRVPGWERARSLLFANLLAQIPLVTEFLNLVKLRFDPVHVFLFVLEQPLKQLA